jgi:hypothetical protein
MRDLHHADLENYSIQQLSDLRDWQLNRVQTVTEVLREKVKAEAEQGTPITILCKQAGVTRKTIYHWLEG